MNCLTILNTSNLQNKSGSFFIMDAVKNSKLESGDQLREVLSSPFRSGL